MDEREIRKEVDLLTELIKESEKKVSDIQSVCLHKHQSVKDVKSKSELCVIRLVCDACDAVIGYPTEKQIRDSGYN